MRILFVHNALRSFVAVDRDILSSEHEIDELDLSHPSQLVGLPARVARADLVYAWFASLHSLGPVLTARGLRKPSIVVVGGYDTAAEPGIGYGSMAHPVKRHIVRLICDAATELLVNSKTAVEEVRRNVRTSTPISMVYHGFEPFPGSLTENRAPIALTVGNVSSESLHRKGHRVFADAARFAPEVRFILAGSLLDEAARQLRARAASNLELPGYLSQPALNHLLEQTSAYVQASAHEGFGCAVAEAMAAGCVPVISRRGALPEVVGQEGIYLDAVTPEGLANTVRCALDVPLQRRLNLAHRVATEFPLSARRDRLLTMVERVQAGYRRKAPS